MDPVVAFEQTRKQFDETLALSGVTLSVEKGEMFAVVGPDGAGKTTLLRAITGLVRADSGLVRVFGLDLSANRRDIRDRVGYLSQGFSLYRDLSIDENIAFFARIHGIRDFKKRRDDLLAFTRLRPFRKRLAGRLSGGMKKKLALACALVHQPELLLLDEPTTGVDPVSRRDFWVILGDLLQQGLTIVVATPYLDEAERCSRVGLLQDGSFLTIGTPDEIRRSTKGDLFEAICDDPREAQRRLRTSSEAFAGSSTPVVQTYGDRIHVKFPGAASGEELKDLLAGAGVTTTSVRRIEPSLEDVYISLVEQTQ